ncbi:PH domain-containing protein [Liberiplasma polymorphum]|uniref:PH domain-containing protein n=1 Tax=Liberiplasma polymorphum TaxID=3374570 RepID=UPI00377192B8
MIDKPKERIPISALNAWRLNGLIAWIIELLIPTTYVIVRIYVPVLPLWPAVMGYVFFGILGLLQIFVIPKIRMIYWGYEIKENEIDIQYGIIVIRRSLIPMNRVQHVDIAYGPVLRLFNLASLSVTTAGSNHKIPALKIETAKTLHTKISGLIQQSDDDV